MKVQTKHAQTHGFTLIEMIGVLAIIAILASLLVPKVFNAITESRVANAVQSLTTIRSAAAEHYGKWGKFCQDAVGTGLAANVETWDQTVLLSEQRIDKPFALKIGDGATGAAGTRVRAATIGALKTGDAVTADAGYDLDGAGAGNEVTGAWLIEAVITGVAPQDAKDLNDRIDGTTLGTAVGTADMLGRIKYDAPDATGLTTVHVYLTHR